MICRLLRSRFISKIFRYSYRYTHSRAWRHNQAIWPLIKVQRDMQHRLDDCLIRGVTRPQLTDLALEPRPVGHTVHIILSGPSISDIQYDTLQLEHVMGVNGSIALLQKYPELRFTHYVMLDAGFVQRRRKLVEDILRQDLLLFTTPEVLKTITLWFKPEQIRCRIAIFEEVHHRCMQPRLSPEAVEAELADDPDLILFDAYNPEHAHGFSLDIQRGMFGGGTVAYSALQIATWLGFQQIYLHGLDLTDAHLVPRFYEDKQGKLGTSLSSQLESHIKPAFRAASALLRARQVQVYNLSPDSALGEDIFPKVDWRSCRRKPDATTG